MILVSSAKSNKHPVKDLTTNKVEITSQNHGFEVDAKSIPKNVKVTHKSLFDGSIEGIEVKDKKLFSVQYHPEANPGPQDSKYLFEKFFFNIKLNKNGKKKRLLKKNKVELIGAKASAISRAEDRALFRKAMKEIKLDLPKSEILNSFKNSKKVFKKIGLPAIIRPSFTLGGSGGGIAKTKKEFFNLIKSGITESPQNQVLVEESLEGWKEFEMEVVRDKKDNCIIICSIENVDPMGTIQT